MAYARAVRDPDGQWRFQALEEHLFNVAGRADASARSFGSGEIASLAGLWHDLGKYSPDFQRYLLDVNDIASDREDASIEGMGRRVDHSSAGALLALERLGPTGRILAQLIAAHHHGLYDSEVLVQRLAHARGCGRLSAALASNPPPDVLEVAGVDFPTIPGTVDPTRPEPLAYSLYLRMLFSCLVDADVLDSEAFANQASSRLRTSFESLAALKPRFDEYMAAFAPDTPVKQLRAEVLADCRDAAQQPHGLFTLTVPTGGGKTLSSMAFALEHAARWGFKRVIYVIPYTSIIEQTADVFRSIFGEAVVEHHSNIEGDRETARSRLASENWDAPIVVTTNVQFFESLFAARTSHCRKLHNILESVVVLDEAQLLPPDFLQPIVDVLRLLSSHYPVSVVLSTATQPVLNSRERFGASFRGIDSAREITRNPDSLYQRLKRVRVALPEDLQQPTTWESIAERVAAEHCVLAIVNRRADARELHRRLPSGAIHLSALMCGAHRSDVLNIIHQRLSESRVQPAAPPLRVVSTQLVEAGVDIDFPVVFRAFAGLDSIAQAAGRCNREGSMSCGWVHVFVPPKGAPPGMLRLGEQACRSVMHGLRGDPLQRELYARYFDEFYRGCDLDKQGIVRLLRPDRSGGVVGLREAADRFRLIQNEQTGVLVPYQRNADDHRCLGLLAALRKEGPERGLLRRLQRYSVSLPPWEFERLKNAGDLEEIYPGIWALIAAAQYDADLGLLVDPAIHPPVLMA
ncbi:MAG: CRISPR-associated endonuclease Cas3'' [Steroidobacteraceae bacterium]